MMNNRFATVGFCLWCLSALLRSGVAQETAVLDADRQIIQFTREKSELMTNLQYLCDVIGPRLTGSERMKRANDWVAEKMKEYGLENVHLESYTIPRGWERGTVQAELIEPTRHPISAASMGWTPGTKGTITGPVVYFNPANEGEMQAFRGKLKNAIVLTSPPSNVNHHPSRATGTDEFDDEQPPGRGGGMRAQLDSFMRKEGVAAILRDSGKPHMLLNMTGSWRSPDPLPTLFITNESYRLLYRFVREGKNPKMRLKIEARFTRGPVTVYNTVGEIRGSEKPDEYVICGAHLDSWDLGTGTTDNGTGSMIVLEAARTIKQLGLKPKRTIRFVLFSGEEQGLHGSRAYVQQHKHEWARISAVFVHDTGTGKVTGIGLHGNSQVQPVLEKELAVLKDLGVERYNPGMMGGTDHASFYSANVPGFWFIQDPADYNLTHHTQSDTFDKALKDDLIQSAAVMAICAYNVAQLPDLLPRRAAQ